MRIRLNLASRPFANIGPAIKRLRMALGGLALFCVLLVVGIYAVHQKAEAARAHEHSLDGAIGRVTAERQGYQRTMQLPVNAQLLTQAEALNQLFDEKAFSWTLAMESLETVLPGGVQVTAIEPIRAKDGHITLHLRVVGPRDKSEDLVKNLEHSTRFLMPRIVGENAEANDNPNQRLEPVSASNRFDFDLLAEYNPPGEPKAIAVRKSASSEDESDAVKTPVRAHRPTAPGAKARRAPYTGPSRAKPVHPKPNPAQVATPMQGGSR